VNRLPNVLPCVSPAVPMGEDGVCRRDARQLAAGRQTQRAGGARLPVNRLAFTLIETMVVVVLLAVIVIGLTAMFVQTQRAFRAGMTQTDVLEAGRMATEMISRELEQITPSGGLNWRSADPVRIATNLRLEVRNVFVQTLVANDAPRTNIQDDLFFITHENTTWRGIGYFVRSNEDLTVPPLNYGAVGTLYRFEMEQPQSSFNQRPNLLFFNFNQARFGFDSNHVSKIIEGVIGFKVRTYDVTNNWLTPYLLSNIATNYSMWTHDNLVLGPMFSGEVADSQFYSNAIPAFLEFELAVLEPNTYERYKSIPIYDAQTNYLAHQAGRVHVFRQRVAVRNVDPLAYQ
jgi:type II secretory pathway pseudopilin PulG